MKYYFLFGNILILFWLPTPAMCRNPAIFLEISSFVDFFQNIIEFVTTLLKNKIKWLGFIIGFQSWKWLFALSKEYPNILIS